MTVSWPRFFGRKYLGSISGAVMGAQVFSSAIGPPVFGLSEKFTGNYSSAIIILAVMNLFLLVGAFCAKSYYKG